MGHSVHSSGYRLLLNKNWKVDLCSDFTNSYYFILEEFFGRFFGHWFPLTILFSHFCVSSSPSGRLKLSIFFYNHAWQLLLRHFFILSKRSLGFDLYSYNPGGSVLPSVSPSLNHNLNSGFFLFLRSFLSSSFVSVLERMFLKVGLLNRFCIFVEIIDGPFLFQFLFCRIIQSKLRRRRSLGKVVNSFLSTKFSKLVRSGVLGISVKAVGRFSRTQRASSFSIRKGKTPFSTMSVFVDYFSLPIILKYGICNLKVWVSYNTFF